MRTNHPMEGTNLLFVALFPLMWVLPTITYLFFLPHLSFLVQDDRFEHLRIRGRTTLQRESGEGLACMQGPHHKVGQEKAKTREEKECVRWVTFLATTHGIVVRGAKDLNGAFNFVVEANGNNESLPLMHS
jgi:hypothetical protein